MEKSRMKVICISGHARHGKDTVARFMRDALLGECKVLVVHYADLLKYICTQFFGWDGVKDDAGRTLLQYVGTDIIRKKQPNFWVDFVTSILTLFNNNWNYVLIPDCRFPNEIDCMRERGFDVTHVRIVRDGFKSPLSKEQQEHPSETALDNYPIDYLIHNDGALSDLREKVSDLIADMNGAHQLTFQEVFECAN